MQKVVVMLLLLATLMQPGRLTAQSLSEEEKTGLLFMYEEEKLARDVYDSMFVKWELMPFENVRQSERRHMRELKGLVSDYKLEDPIKKNKDVPGLFSDASLQALYNDLVAKGSQSLTASLKAGALIEEVDIRDLQERKKKVVHNDILEAYDFLIMGSENHLRAFCRNLEKQGVKYEPAVLSRSEFDRIIADAGKGHGCNH